MLIYLSPSGEGPSRESLPLEIEALVDNWADRFSILPYHGLGLQPEVGENSDEELSSDTGEKDDPYQDFRASFALTNWLEDCIRMCRVEKLNWFLKDVESYCKQEFGRGDMTSDIETKAVKDFLYQNLDELRVAKSVAETWPIICYDVFEDFLQLLLECLKKQLLKEFSEYTDIEVDRRFLAPPKDGSTVIEIYIYRECWHKHTGSQTPLFSRNAVVFEARIRSKDWMCGVRSGNAVENMEDKERRNRNELQERIKKGIGDKLNRRNKWWTNYMQIRDIGDWESLIPELAIEVANNKKNANQIGEITKRFVEPLIGTAKVAIPIIDEVETG